MYTYCIRTGDQFVSPLLVSERRSWVRNTEAASVHRKGCLTGYPTVGHGTVSDWFECFVC